MKVLITGGAGFIGSHLCDTLVSKGEDVVILDNLSTGSKKNIAHLEGKIKVFQGDIRDQKLVESLVEDSDLVFHMAASLGVENILENPIDSISTNFYGSEIVLNASAKFDKRIFIASTSEIYGKNSKQPLSETDDRVVGNPQKLRWTYSDAKALEEATAYSLFITKKLKVTTVRLFNTVGPRQSGQYGMVMPRFIESAIYNRPITIFGDGSQKRVFCHVNDVISALLYLLSSKKTIGEVFNIGGKDELSILELAKRIINQTGSSSKLTFTEYNLAYGNGFEETFRRVPDISKIKTYVNWEPVYSVEEIIKDLTNYYFKET